MSTETDSKLQKAYKYILDSRDEAYIDKLIKNAREKKSVWCR